MIFLVLGIILGLLIGVLIFVGLIYLQKRIERITTIIRDKIEKTEKGSIIEPISELEEEQLEVIAKNRKVGSSTKLLDITPE